MLPAILLCISGNIFSKHHCPYNGEWLLERIFNYKSNIINNTDTTIKQLYLKHTVKSLRRNPTLFIVPTMYTIAKGKREYIRETYGNVTIYGNEILDFTPLIVCGTIRKNKKAMPIIINYVMPNLYSELLFSEQVLSPFHKNNAKFYEYKWTSKTDSTTMLTFTSRINNTRLVEGYATVDISNGRIIDCCLKGSYDMLDYIVNVDMGKNRNDFILPQSCDINTTFRFMGNKIGYQLKAIYSDSKMIMPDSLVTDQDVMANYRLIPLDDNEIQIYSQYKQQLLEQKDSTIGYKNRKDITEKTLNAIEDNLLNSIKLKSSNASVNISPLLDPLQLSYSNRRGLSYKMKIDTKYNLSLDKYITFKPSIGYNFKINKFFYSAPFRYTISQKKGNWLELIVANGNRITHSSVIEMLNGTNIDTIDFHKLKLDYFNDQRIKLYGNISLSSKIGLMLGCTYHNREAVNKSMLVSLGKQSNYRSFAPLLTISYSPTPQWPLFTANYERSIKGILGSNIEYERWEFDTSYKKELGSLRNLSLRLGGGLYTNRSSTYFVDFENFHEDYLPDGWEDEWTGNFQMLNSDWYNASEYYLRMNVTYESPLMIISRLPIIGKFVETERLYAGMLQIQHTRPYSELGYGFTNKYCSVGAFASILNGSFHEFGCKFTFELFRKW